MEASNDRRARLLRGCFSGFYNDNWCWLWKICLTTLFANDAFI